MCYAMCDAMRCDVNQTLTKIQNRLYTHKHYTTSTFTSTHYKHVHLHLPGCHGLSWGCPGVVPVLYRWPCLFHVIVCLSVCSPAVVPLLSRACPAVVPLLSRGCPAGVPKLSRGCPAVVPLLSV